MAFRDQDVALLAKLEAKLGELTQEIADAKRQLGVRPQPRDGTLAPCPMCGSEHSTWGVLRGQGVHFLDDEAGLLDQMFTVSSSIRARRCDGCRTVVLFDLER
jgi:hypothetical protein